MTTLVRIIGLGLAAFSLTAATLARYPYLQNVGPDHATILWTTTDDPGRGEVVATAGGREHRAPSAVRPFFPEETGLTLVFFLHRVKLTGLSPGTTYAYSIRINGADPLAGMVPLSFRTAAPGAFSFLVVADSGDGKSGQQIIARRMETEDARFVLHAGDLAYENGTFAQLEHYFFSVYRALLMRVPFFVVAGNHDYYDRDGAAYRASFVQPEGPGGERYYSFDWGDVHFTALDTNTPLVEAAEGRGEMLRWLDQDLSRTRRLWRVVFMHHLPFANSHHKDDPDCARVASHVVPILERHGAHLVFTGHEHNYQRTLPRRAGAFAEAGPGTVYVTTGGGGADVHPLEPDARLAAGAALSHYVRVDVGDSEMVVRAIDGEGKQFDEFRLSAAPYVTAVVDAAALRGATAPGGLIAVFGLNLARGQAFPDGLPLPLHLEGTTLHANGAVMPLLYVSRGQINAQVPFHLIPPLTLRIRASGGVAESTVRVEPAAPQIFRIGAGPAAVHLDGRAVRPATPAAPGEWIVVFATGLGDVRGEPVAGEAARAAAAVLPVRAMVGQSEAEVSYAGLAPGFAGLYQINLRIPTAVAGTLPLRILAGSAESEPVPIAIAP